MKNTAWRPDAKLIWQELRGTSWKRFVKRRGGELVWLATPANADKVSGGQIEAPLSFKTVLGGVGPSAVT